jgi:uncharacterized membrane protein
MNETLEDLAAAPGPLHGELAWLAHALEWASTAIDLVAIAIMLIGAVRFTLGFAAAEVRANVEARVQGIDRHRAELGRYILAALELLIVSDIIHTALSLELSDLAFLGVLVLIRSVISFFLDRELRDIRDELGEAGR